MPRTGAGGHANGVVWWHSNDMSFFGGNRKLPAIGAQTGCATLEVCLDDDWTGCFRISCANIDWVVLNVYIFTAPKNVQFLVRSPFQTKNRTQIAKFM